MSEKLEELLEDTAGISYNAMKDEFTITMLKDIDTMRELYNFNPVVRKFIKNEIISKKETIHGVESEVITGYELLGFMYRHQGERYTLTGDEVRDL